MRFYARNRKRFKHPVMVQMTVVEAEELRKELDAIGSTIGPAFEMMQVSKFRNKLIDFVAIVRSQ